MPAGILNREVWVNNVKTTTCEIRKSLLTRNLPEPISSSLEDTQFVNYFDDIGKTINIQRNSEKEYVRFDEENTLEIIGEDERDLSFLKNKYVGDEENIYEYLFPSQDLITTPTLEEAYRSYIDPTFIKRNYPTSALEDRFKLIAQGENPGRTNPLDVINSNISTTNETALGIAGLNLLNDVIIKTKGSIEQRQNQSVSNRYLDGLIDTSTTIKSYKVTEERNVNAGDTYSSSLAGSTLPYSILPNESIGWNEYSVIEANGSNPNTALSTEGRSVEMLLKTSDGQKLILFSNLRKNKYIPKYDDPRITQLLGDNAPNSRYYIGDERSTNRGDTLTKRFKPEQFNDSEDGTTPVVNPQDGFYWQKDGAEFNEKTLLGKTQKLVNEESSRVFINQTDKFFKDTNADKIISRGSAIKSDDAIDTSFFRVWTVDNEYSYKNAIKKTGLRFKGESLLNQTAHLSVLQNNGMVKTHPTRDDKFTSLKKYMFSIENLAGADEYILLPECEKGPGDPMTGRKGRLMWFAPYDLQFDENVSANWTSTEFIGRGEPVYTYNNSKRTGQLRFKVVVDHPSVINEYRGRQNNFLEKFFSGGKTYEDLLEEVRTLPTLDLNSKTAVENKLNSYKRQKVNKTYAETLRYTVYFSEDSDEFDPMYPPNSNYNTEIANLSNFLSNSSELVIELKGYAGLSETKTSDELAKGRIESVTDDIISKNIKVGNNQRKLRKKDINGRVDLTTQNPEDNDISQPDRRVEVIVKFSKEESEDIISDEKILEFLNIGLDKISPITIDECNYFDIVDDNFPNYFKTISEKIKYFHPGFHSTTPESLNSRMTFLHQCTRQGPGINDSNSNFKPQNLAFGRPPVCIIRIGDFFHSKVIVNSVSLNYASGGGSPQWDMNPEGIGVQPMIVDVNMSIDIVGGQSLIGPINKIQNALSFNYYANTEMYDKRADSIIYKNGQLEFDRAKYPGDLTVQDVNVVREKVREKVSAITNQKDNSTDSQRTNRPRKGTGKC